MEPNIITIDHQLQEWFHTERRMLPVLKRRIRDLQLTLEEVSDEHKETLINEIDKLASEYTEIETGSKFHFYILETRHLIDEYTLELSKPIEIDFMGRKKDIDNFKLRDIHNRFVDVVRKIYPIERIVPKRISTCTTCGHDKFVTDKTNISICERCGTENDNLEITFSYKDSERINITSKYTYDRRVHFKECINQFQGKQNCTIKPEVFDKLIEQFTLHGLVREGDLHPKIKYEKVTKHHVVIFLYEINCSHHYEDLNLIYHLITKNELDDISHLEQVLMEDFDRLSEAYNEEYIKNKKISRKNFINTQYVLFQLLRRHKYPCSRNDFSLLKTIERKGFHDDICSHLFKKLGWNFTPVF